MRKSRWEAARTRKRIIEAAAKEFRRNGIARTGLADLMAAAGLTHGGFYRHFESKDQLVAEACAAGEDCLICISGKRKAGVVPGGRILGPGIVKGRRCR